MLHVIRTTADPLIDLIRDDPVRPEIPSEHRVGPHKEVLVLLSDDATPHAVVCVSYQDQVPSTVAELTAPSGDATIAVFYTIWSYATGAGQEMIFQARDHVIETRPTVTRFVTLSPPTEMARRFHLKNGAVVFRTNIDTVNYEYHS
jgi:hypothetical protein